MSRRNGPWDDAIAAVLFCAGRGERLRPFTDSVAKPALVVGGRPLAAYALDTLTPLDGTLAVNLSWLHEATRAVLEPHAPPGTEWLVELPAPLGTAGTVAALLPRLGASFVVMNGDTITDLDVRRLIAAHRRLGRGATLAVTEVSRGADFEVDGDRTTRMIVRQRDPEAPGVRYVGAAVFERDAVARCVRDLAPPVGLAEAVFGPMTSRREVSVHRHEGLALDVGTPEALAAARSLADAGRLPRR